jgi:hypothetical protein
MKPGHFFRVPGRWLTSAVGFSMMIGSTTCVYWRLL